MQQVGCYVQSLAPEAADLGGPICNRGRMLQAGCGGKEPGRAAAYQSYKSKVNGTAKKLAKVAESLSTLIGFVPGFLCGGFCTAASMVLEFIGAIGEFVAGDYGGAIKDLIETGLDGAGFVVGGMTESEIAYQLSKRMGVVMHKVEIVVKDVGKVTRYLPNGARKLLNTAIGGIVNGLTNLEPLLNDSDFGGAPQPQ